MTEKRGKMLMNSLILRLLLGVMVFSVASALPEIKLEMCLFLINVKSMHSGASVCATFLLYLLIKWRRVALSTPALINTSLTSFSRDVQGGGGWLGWVFFLTCSDFPRAPRVTCLSPQIPSPPEAMLILR